MNSNEKNRRAAAYTHCYSSFGITHAKALEIITKAEELKRKKKKGIKRLVKGMFRCLRFR